jgi:NitT/TauT family transport system ATP-binding protein
MRDRIRCRSVSFHYGPKTVFRDLSVSISDREFVACVGVSGCGKSTFLNLIAKRLRPSQGELSVHGTTRTVYQHSGLLPWLTVLQNIHFGCSGQCASGSDQSRQWLNLVDAAGCGHQYPHELSGGMRQRVELARVLAGTGDILLLDEPFSALDFISRLTLRDLLIRTLATVPRTVVLITHDLIEAAQLADRILVMSGTPSTILLDLALTSQRPRPVHADEVTAAVKTIIHALQLPIMDTPSETLCHATV